MDNKLLDIRQLSEYLSVPVSSIRVWLALKQIPYYKIGRRVKFRVLDIEKWLESKHQKAVY